MSHDDPLQEAGEAVRRQVLGDAHVDRTQAAATPFSQPFQDYITRAVWGGVWSRDGLDRKTRRLLTLALLAGLGREHELEMHVRAALADGVSQEELAEVFLHTGVYAGVPTANRAFAIAQRAIEEDDGDT
ncbi:MAG: 4-carboxymuconolactone decarboxylase [Conexibacter sp.]